MAEQMNATPATEAKTLEIAQEAVMVKSVPVPDGTPIVKGYDFNKGRDLDGIMAAAMTTGFQVGVRGVVVVDLVRQKSLGCSWSGHRRNWHPCVVVVQVVSSGLRALRCCEQHGVRVIGLRVLPCKKSLAEHACVKLRITRCN